MGPMSFAIDKKGRVHVLDEVNGRISRRDAEGNPDKDMKIDLVTPEDIAIADDGTMAVLDRHQGNSVSVYDESGNLKGALPLEGELLDDRGEVTGVFVDGNDVYAEREHGPLVKLGDLSGIAAVPRTEIPGRPSRDGKSYLKAGITDAQAGRVYVVALDKPSMEHRFTRELKLQAYVRQIVLLDSDMAGTIYFAAEIEREGGEALVRLSCLEPLKGVVVGNAELPVNTLPEETFKDYVVLDEGGVMYALRTETGVSYQLADCN